MKSIVPRAHDVLKDHIEDIRYYLDNYTTYVRWKSGLLISSDWLRPVTRGAWRGVLSGQVDEPNPTHDPGESS